MYTASTSKRTHSCIRRKVKTHGSSTLWTAKNRSKWLCQSLKRSTARLYVFRITNLAKVTAKASLWHANTSTKSWSTESCLITTACLEISSLKFWWACKILKTLSRLHIGSTASTRNLSRPWYPYLSANSHIISKNSGLLTSRRQRHWSMT